MSETDGQEKCNICEDEYVNDIQAHLVEEHADEPEELEREYGWSDIDDILDASADCPLCESSVDKLDSHLYTEHSVTASQDWTEEQVETALGKVTGVDISGEGTCPFCRDSVDDYDDHLAARHNVTPGAVAAVQPAETVEDDHITDASSTNGDRTDAGSETEGTADHSSAEAEGMDEVTESSPEDLDEVSGKWYVFGIGGAGNGILDAVLMRRDSLSEDHPMAGIWGNGGMQGYYMLNTNDDEVIGTYYAQVDNEWGKTRVVEDNIVGEGGGAGQDAMLGRELMDEGIDNNQLEEMQLSKDDVRQGQGTLYLHSVEGGTGTGMTPVLASYLRDNEKWAGEDKPTVAGTIIPDSVDDSYVNTVYGLGMLSKEVDAIIPFSNSNLADSKKPEARIDFSLGPQQKVGHESQNETLVRFLEAYTMPSNTGLVDVDGTDRAGHDGFDIRDSYQPVKRKYPKHLREPFKPATVCAPLFQSIETRDVAYDDIEYLVEKTLNHGRLIDFDPATAWGGTFLFLGPPRLMDQVASHVADDDVKRMVRESTDGEFLKLTVDQAVIPTLDALYLWGVMWNPRIPVLEAMYEKARDEKENGFRTEENEMLDEEWNTLSPVFDQLGLKRAYEGQ